MSIRYKILIWFLAIGIIPVLFVSVLFYQNSKKTIENTVVSGLISIADMKKRELEEWLRERLRDLQISIDNEDIEKYLTLHRSNIINKPTVDYVNDPNHVLTTIHNLKEIYNYNRVYLTDFSGKILVSTNPKDEGRIVDAELVNKTIIQKNTYIKDIYLSDTGKKLMSFAGPVHATHETLGSKHSTEVVGILVLDIEMDKTVFSIIQELAGMRKSGEILIARKSDDGIEFLNPLKYPASSVVGLNLSNKKILSGRLSRSMFFATQGDEGVIRSLDYRGVKVLSAYRNISLMGWGFIVKEDLADAFFSIISMRDRIILVVIFLVIFLISLTFLVARQITKRLELLRYGVEIVQKGNWDYQVNIQSNDEIGKLSQAFDELLQFIKNSRTKIDKKVLNQTSQIREQGKKLNLRQKAILNVLGDIEVEKKFALQERDKVNIILQSIGDGVFVLDKNYRIIVFNMAASFVSGFSEKEAVGKIYGDVLKFTFQSNGEVNKKFIVNAMEKGVISRMSNHTFLTKKNGKQIVVADSAAPIKDGKGKILGCVVVFRDATKEAEVDRMKTEFVSLASHQLNTPLTGIKWFLELLIKGRAGKLTDKQQELVSNIEFSNNRMIGLVNDLLNVSRIESGTKFIIEKKNINIINIIHNSIKRHQQLASKNKVKIKLSTKIPKKLILEVDERKIDQVFGNLISNAIKYSKINTIINIGFKEKGDEIVFFVKNSGLGIPKIQQKRIFEKFFRADNIMTTDTEGNGLGLYIVRAIIEAHGGRVWFESVVNKTTTFYVSLPKG